MIDIRKQTFSIWCQQDFQGLGVSKILDTYQNYGLSRLILGPIYSIKYVGHCKKYFLDLSVWFKLRIS